MKRKERDNENINNIININEKKNIEEEKIMKENNEIVISLEMTEPIL